MIYFACKTIDLSEIFQCSFGIKKNDYKVLDVLLESKKPKTVKEIAKQLNKERTTVQKSMSLLLKKQLVYRRQMNISTGGYVYVYSIKDRDSLKKELTEIIKAWNKEVLRLINDSI